MMRQLLKSHEQKVSLVLMRLNAPVSSYDLGLIISKKPNNLWKILKNLKKKKMISSFKEEGSPYTVYKLTQKGFNWSYYISPLEEYDPSKDILYFLTHKTVSRELNVPISTLRRKKGIFTYYKIRRKVFIIKRIPLRHITSWINENIPYFPELHGIKDLFHFLEDPPQKLISEIYEKFYRKNMAYYNDIIDFLLTQGIIYSNKS